MNGNNILYALLVISIISDNVALLVAAAALLENNNHHRRYRQHSNIRQSALTGLASSAFIHLWNNGTERDIMIALYLPKNKVMKLHKIIKPWFKKYTWETGKELKLIKRKRKPSKRSKIKSLVLLCLVL